MKRLMVGAAVSIVAIMILTGCANHNAQVEKLTEIQEVVVPVYTKLSPIPELSVMLDYSHLPVFVAPTSPEASSCLTVTGESQFRGLTGSMKARIDAWEKWGL